MSNDEYNRGDIMFNDDENLFIEFFIPTEDELVEDAIYANDHKLFYNVFSEMNHADIASHIDDWIIIAIDYERHEFVAYLVEYKYKHDLYQNPNWEL